MESLIKKDDEEIRRLKIHRDRIQKMIESIKNMVGESGYSVDDDKIELVYAKGEYYGHMDTETAILTYLKYRNKPATVREIADDLKEGGYDSKSNDPYPTIHAAVNRLAKREDSPIIKRGKEWCLVEKFFEIQETPHGENEG